jgi:hypothetical protein
MVRSSPKDETWIFLILSAPDTECFQIFLETLAKKYYKELILLFVGGAGNHGGDEANMILHLLSPYSLELNPQENIWDEIRESINGHCFEPLRSRSRLAAHEQ